MGHALVFGVNALKKLTQRPGLEVVVVARAFGYHGGANLAFVKPGHIVAVAVRMLGADANLFSKLKRPGLLV